MFSGDFVKLTSATGANGVHQAVGTGADDAWTDQEILLLLEGVELFDDDWSAIEEHVGTRSAQQCIRKFLQLPIEDPYVTAEGDMGPLRFARIPFEQADNPVMSVVAFLAGVISPGVAAEAAKTALHELTDGDRKDVEEKQDGAAKVAEDGEDKKDEKMDEDGAKDGEKPAAAGHAEAMQVDAQPGESSVQKAAKAIPHSRVVRAPDLALKSASKAAGALADAEETQIRTTLASLIKLTLTKLELKTAQFEELEELLEEERKSLESARMALVNERVNLKRMLEHVKGELAKHGSGPAVKSAVEQAEATLVASGQGTRVNEVQGDVTMEGDMGQVPDPNLAQLS